MKIALISIKYVYSEKIFCGEKRVEFRKTNFNDEVDYVIIYETKPTSKLVGYFKIGKIVSKKPLELWTKYREIGGISKKQFMSYYAGAPMGVALEIENLFKFVEPLDLQILGGHVKPPQSFMYISDQIFNSIIATCGKIEKIHNSSPPSKLSIEVPKGFNMHANYHHTSK